MNKISEWERKKERNKERKKKILYKIERKKERKKCGGIGEGKRGQKRWKK